MRRLGLIVLDLPALFLRAFVVNWSAEKEIYERCYELVVPRLVPGGLLVADNVINHEATLRPMLDRALSDHRVDALVVPIGKGELVCQKR